MNLKTNSKTKNKTSKKALILPLLGTLLLGACTNSKSLKKDITKIIEANPEIIIASIKKNPEKYIMALNSAAKDAQIKTAKLREVEELKKLEESFNTPLVPVISKEDAIRGQMSAPITLVEYSDFECPYCARGTQVVDQLRAKYGKKIKVIYKHLPLDFHKQAMISAKYFEAIKLQSTEKAYRFHDELFSNQRKLQKGESYLKEIAKTLNINMTKLTADIESDIVAAKIKKDSMEANKFGFSGTPGFILNGVAVRGAYPSSHFEKIINELIKRRKLTI
jgi:protein-disulfide isomerase